MSNRGSLPLPEKCVLRIGAAGTVELKAVSDTWGRSSASMISVNSTAPSDTHQLAAICDQDSIRVRGRAPKNEVLWAEGLISGKPVIVFATNPAVAGGALGADAS